MDVRHLLDGMPAPNRPENDDPPSSAATVVDRISDLPTDVLHHLLSLLPAHESVRTCVLARRWRHLWRHVPALRITGVEGFGSSDKFNRFAGRLLRLRGLPGSAPLDSCDLDFDPRRFDFRASVRDRAMTRFVRRAARLKVRVLTLRLHEFRKKIMQPHTRLDLTLVSRHLTRLELDGVRCDCVLDFSGCPALVVLKLEQCYIAPVEISSLSLEHLSIAECSFHPGERALISTPSLVSLELIKCAGATPFIESMPLLATANVALGTDSDCYLTSDSETCVLLDALSEATDLDLSAPANKLCLFKSDLKLCPTFGKLKILVLNDWCVAADLSALIWFLQHSPVLEKLTLRLSKVHKISEGTEETYNPLEQFVASDHLKIVEIKCEEVAGMVIKIFEILNACGIPLEQINIQRHFSFEELESTEEEEEEEEEDEDDDDDNDEIMMMMNMMMTKMMTGFDLNSDSDSDTDYSSDSD